MTVIRSVCAEDEIPDATVPPRASDGVVTLSTERLLGTWFATDHHARGAVELRLSEVGDALSVRVFGAAAAEPVDWGRVRATPYAAGVTADTAIAFTAVFEFGFRTASLAAYVKQGILVLDTFARFTDGSSRADYFSREFFHR
ncbi:hypothetical protein [Saccharothrix stipae]